MKTLISKLIAPAVIAMTIVLSPHVFAGSSAVSKGAGWDNVKQTTTGSWAIARRDGRYFIDLASDFKARKAPDLKIYLSKKSAGSLNNSNGLQQATFVAKLSSHKGKQSYALPKGLTPSDFESLVIYCEAYSKFWAAASL